MTQAGLNVASLEALAMALARIDARKLALVASVLLHVGALAWVFTTERRELGYQTPRQYIQVSLRTEAAPKAKTPRKAKRKKAAAKPKPKPKPKKEQPLDLDKIAASIAAEEKPVPPAPIVPPAPPEAKPDPTPGPGSASDIGLPDEKAEASISQPDSLLGVLPDWCPQDEALLSVEDPSLRTLYDIYISSIKNRVSDNWYIPPVLAADAQCTIFIEQLVSGDIVRYEFAYCSGGDEFRRSVEEAIRRTTLPIPPDRRLYSRCIGFDFIPGEL